jgi:hypothetical protein
VLKLLAIDRDFYWQKLAHTCGTCEKRARWYAFVMARPVRMVDKWR